MTPEGRVKRAIQATLYRHRDYVWVNMPVPGGWGRPTLDYVGCCCGLFFGVEAKRKGARPTPRQELTMHQITRAGGRVFLVTDEDSLKAFDAWITTVVEQAVGA